MGEMYDKFKDIINRLGHSLVAFAGVILASTSAIDWTSPQFWAGVIVAAVPAFRNSTDKYVPARFRQ